MLFGRETSNITRGILYGFTAMILLFAAYGIFTYRSSLTLLSLTSNIYNHPLAVSNASLRANANLVKMQITMRDILSYKDYQVTESSIDKLDLLEKNTLKELQVIRQNIFGAEGERLTEETIEALKGWRPIRERVISFVKKGDYESAIKFIRKSGVEHVKVLESRMFDLTGYAGKEAAGFFREYQGVQDRVEQWSLVIFCVWVIISGLIIYITIRSAGATERQLSHEKEKLNVTLMSIGDGFIATDEKGRITLINDIAELLTGWEKQDALGQDIRKCFNIIDEEKRTPCENPVLRVLSTKKIVEPGSHARLISRDGTERIIASSAGPIRDRDAEILGVVLVFRDRTEQYRIRQEIMESEKMFRLLSENTLDVIWAMDMNLEFTYVNPAIYDVTGYSVEEWIGSRLPDHCDEENFSMMSGFISGDLKKGYGGEGVFFEAELLNKNREPIPLEIRGKILYGPDNKPVGIQGVSRDISERKKVEKDRDKLQKQLNQAQKMESVGRLAGGVAHDFNNMLGVIIGYTELLLDNQEEGGAQYEDLQEILQAAKRSSEITKQLLAFARKQTIKPRVIDLNRTVESMLKMIRRLIGEDIDLIWFPCEGLLEVNIDPMQVDQIMANLCVNARDAIEGVGKVTIETDHVFVDSEYCRDHPEFIPGEYVVLLISDNGTGMEPETLEMVFDPFFTTKGIGQGTGLGLSTVYGIVKQNEGMINIYSEKGRGTTFRIYLPRHKGDVLDAGEVEITETPRSHGETVLIVEDDPGILKIGRRILEQLDYKILFASTPGEALNLVREFRGNIDLIITDVIMPEMNGRDLSNRVKLFYPDLKVLFMSGYTANVIAHSGVLDKGVHFIQKPFSKKQFAVKIREALEG